MNSALLIGLCILGSAVIALAVGLQRVRRREQEARADASEGLRKAERQLAQLREELEEEKSSASEAASQRDRLAALLDHLPQPVWQRDSAGRLSYCNLAYARAAGHPRDHALEVSAPLVEQTDRDSAERMSRTAQSSGSTQTRRFHLVVEGERRFMELCETPGRAGSILGYARDLTDWEEVKQELERHLESQQAVLEHLGVGVAIIGADMHLAFHNPAYAEIWRFDEQFLESAPHVNDMLQWLRDQRRLPEQADFTAYRQNRLRQFQSLIEPEDEYHHLPDGRTLRASLHPHPFGGVILTFEDVTDRLRLERTYNTLLAVQRETLDSLHEGVAVFGSDGRLRLCNPAFGRIWNLPVDWLAMKPHVREITQRCRDLFNVTDEEWPFHVEGLVARTTEPQHDSGRMERRDGSILDWIQVPLPDGDCVYSYVDATDSVRVERALRERNEALETADRLKSEFIANISYELRTPLNAIIGFAEILQNRYFGELNERQQEYAGAIVESSDRLMSLINDILDLASIEAGYMQLDQKEVEVRRLLDSVSTLWKERAYSRQLTLTVSCPADIGALQCDERRLGQALFNLLSNAFRFTPDGGTVEVSASRQEGKILLQVSDDGVGIPPEEQAGILGRSEVGRLSRTRRRRAGSGLGLVLVKSLVELHGGWLDFQSEVNKGTVATCHLPIAGPEAPDAERDKQAGGP